jgi:FlgD Ig-like domain
VHGDLNFASPLLADLDQDANEDLEVVLWAAWNGNLFVWHHDGTELIDGDQNPSTNGVLVSIPNNSFNYGSPAVAQLDADPELEIVMAVNLSVGNIGAVYAYNIDGTPVPGWPFLTGGGGNNSQVSSSVAVADLDEDGDEEIIISCERSGGLIYVLNHDATVFPGWPRFAPAFTNQGRLPSPVLGDLEPDGFLDIVFVGTDGVLRAWDRHGNTLPGFPVVFYGDAPAEATQSTPALGSIDSDGHLEIVFGDEAGRLHAYNHDGTLAAGFPIQTNGEVRGTPALWDIDGDNLVEVALAGFDGNVYVWDLTATFFPNRFPWPFFRHDTRNTGRVLTDPATGMGEPGAASVAVPMFHPVFPNPFNPRATLRFDVAGERGGARPVRLDIFDPAGRLVRRLIAGPVASGPQSVVWDGRGTDGRALGSGVYFARITIGDFVASQKLTLLR